MKIRNGQPPIRVNHEEDDVPPPPPPPPAPPPDTFVQHQEPPVALAPAAPPPKADAPSFRVGPGGGLTPTLPDLPPNPFGTESIVTTTRTDETGKYVAYTADGSRPLNAAELSYLDALAARRTAESQLRAAEAAAAAAATSSSTGPFTTGPSAPTRPPSPNLPDVSRVAIPLELEDFTARYKLSFGLKDGVNCWHKTDGTQMSLEEEAIALRRAALLQDRHSAAVGVAANNARAAGTILTTANMHVFLGDASAPREHHTGLLGMNPQWVPGRGPPPAFDASGAPIPGSRQTLSPLLAVINASATQSNPVSWPPPPATDAQRQEYERWVSWMRSGQNIVSDASGPGLPPPPNPETTALLAQRLLPRRSINDLAELSHRLVVDAARCEALGPEKLSRDNLFFNNPALFNAFKTGNAAAFAAALG